ncbi:hypothetical protein ScPMuIL_006576 [Solemya velum]
MAGKQEGDIDEDARLRKMVESHKEKFGKYLQPSEVMDFMPSLSAEIKELIQDCEKQDRKNAVSLLIGKVTKSNELLNQFCVALERRGYDRLYQHIVQYEDDELPGLSSFRQDNTANIRRGRTVTAEHFEFILRLLAGELVNLIVPSDMLVYLVASDCLKEEDSERILAKEDTCGATAACREMFNLLPRRKGNWAILFYEALQHHHRHVLKKLGSVAGFDDDTNNLKKTVQNDETTGKTCHDGMMLGDSDIVMEDTPTLSDEDIQKSDLVDTTTKRRKRNDGSAVESNQDIQQGDHVDHAIEKRKINEGGTVQANQDPSNGEPVTGGIVPTAFQYGNNNTVHVHHHYGNPLAWTTLTSGPNTGAIQDARVPSNEDVKASRAELESGQSNEGTGGKPEEENKEDEGTPSSEVIMEESSEVIIEDEVTITGAATGGDGLKCEQNICDIEKKGGDECEGGLLFSDEEEDETSEKTVDRVDNNSSLKMRDYQLELAEPAVNGTNTIICAGTGSGKTRVAVYVMRKHIEQFAKQGKPAKVVFFARTVPLVAQQYRAIRSSLAECEVLSLTGEDDRSLYLHKLLENYDIIVLTPQVLVNHLKEGTVHSLSLFSMLIFDECHHTQKGEPYNSIMKRYLKLKYNGQPTPLPQILGLTASIGVGKATTEEAAMDNILGVCANMDVPRISTVEKNLEEYTKFVHVPEESKVVLEERQDDPVKNVLESDMKQIEDELRNSDVVYDKECQTLLYKIPRDRSSQDYYSWTLKLTKRVKLNIEDGDIHRSSITLSSVLRAYNRALEVNELLRTQDVIAHLLDGADVNLTHGEKETTTDRTLNKLFKETRNKLNRILRDSSSDNPNLQVILDCLDRCFKEMGKDSRFIIFVRTRVAAMALSDFLMNNDFKCSHLTGTGTSEEEGGMTQADQENIIGKMKEGTFNGVVATTVAEEGIDISDCNIILRYNHVGNEISTVQTKGRSRKKGGKSVLFANRKMVEREEMNIMRASLMNRAIQLIRVLDPRGIQAQLQRLQQEILKEEEIKELLCHGELSRKQTEEFKLICGKCRGLTVEGSDIKMIGTCHVIVDPSFIKKIDKQQIKPKNFDGISIFADTVCNRCNNRLGKMMRKDGVDFPVIRIEAFTFVNTTTGKKNTFKKWKEVPYKIQPADPSDYQDVVQKSN